MAVQAEHHPTLDIDGGERKEERQRQRNAARRAECEDLVWLLSGRRGRRVVRRQLREAKIEPGRIDSSFNQNYGQMCHIEGLRARGFHWIALVLELLASGELPLDSFQKLMTETD